MLPKPRVRAIKAALLTELKHKYFNVGVDLGCGRGDLAEVMRLHVDYLIGVDLSRKWLQEAQATGLYDQLFLKDVLEYEVRQVDIAFLMDVIEHVTHQKGERVLQKLEKAPYLVLSTPLEFFNFPSMEESPHISLWTEEELRALGFTTRRVYGFFWPPVLFAVRHF